MPNTQAANIDTKANQTLENTSKTEVIVFDGKELKMTQTIKNDTIVVSISYDGETHTVVNDKTSLFLDGKKLNPLSFNFDNSIQASVPLQVRSNSNIKWGNWSTLKKVQKIPNNHLSAIAAIIAVMAPGTPVGKAAAIASIIIKNGYNYIEVRYKSRMGSGTEMLGKTKKHYTYSEQKISFYGKNQSGSTPKYITTVSFNRKKPS